MEPDASERNDTAMTAGRPPGAGALVVAGLGASAGGIEALEAFFAGLPEIDGVAFVVVLHLAPDEESRLADVLQGGLPLPVTQVTESVPIEPGHVYVIPPNKNLLAADGRLVLEPIEEERVRRRPIDHFFRTLAKAYGKRAVGVVLSGTGANGTVGVRAVKEAGGMILAQDPADAAFDEMPRTAIAAGVVDAVGPAGALAAEVAAYAHRLRRVHLPDAPAELPDDGQKALQGVLAQLRARTGHDFAHYKRATVLRRLDRRLHVTGAETLAEYLGHLRDDAAEAQALLADLLISVTNFFRDPEAFAVLAAAVPRLFEGKGLDAEVRVWVPGCATGEEAYSVAMVLMEHAATLAEAPRVQVFATDLSEEAVRTARTGVYPESIEADVSPERLRRFFAHESGRYRVAGPLREAVLFAPHSLLADPPFSRLDLVSCRNVLIYFQRDLQRRALALFHYALRPGGLLFLGTSESTDVGPDLFETLDKKARLFRRLDVETPAPALPHVPRVLSAPPSAGGDAAGPLAPDGGPDGRPDGEARPAGEAERVHRALREQMAPPSVLVGEGGDVAHVSEGAARFLRFVAGTPSRALATVLRPELRAAAQTALFRARREGHGAAGPVSLDLDGEALRVAVRARAAPAGALVQVVFDVLPAAPALHAPPADADGVLAEALRQTEEQLQVSVEEFETSREELRAQNEELQSINEELRSTAEELETSKEEAQSMSEELRTVNDELKAKVDETARAKGDLENLITSTEIATLFLDRELRIQRFTPPVRDLFHVLASDVGRPLGDLAQKFGGARLAEDAEAVVARLSVTEREVEGEDGRWYLVHARPYRTVEDRIDGVVVTFVDITRRKADEAALAASADRAAFRAALADALRDPADPAEAQAQATRLLGEYLGASRVHYAEVGPDGQVVVEEDYTDGVAPLRGRFGADALGPTPVRARRTLVVPDLDADGDLTAEARAAAADLGVAAQVSVPLVKDGRVRAVLSVHQSAPREWTDAEVALVEETAERTQAAVERARAEAALRANEALFDATLSTINDFAYAFDRDGRILFVNQPLLDLWGLTLADVVGKTFHELDYPADLADRLQRQIERVFETGEGLTDDTPYTGADGQEGFYEYIFRPLLADDGSVSLVVGSTRDVTARHQAGLALQAEARRASFRAALADALRSLSDPVEVQAEAARALGEYLGASRVHYAEVEPDGLHAAVARDYARTVPDRSGRYSLADFSFLIAEARAGRTLVVSDVAADDRLSPAEREQYAGLPVSALVVVPLVKDGHLVALFAVHHDAPHDWTDAEAALVEETAERTWGAVERARAEAALRQSEERLRQVAETVPDVLFRADPDGRIDFVNHQFETLTGRPADAVLGTTLWPDLVHPDDREPTEAAWAEARERGGRFEVRHRLVTADGPCWVITRARPFSDGAGAVTAWFGTLTDVDALVRTEDEVRRLNATLEARVAERTEQVRQLSARLTAAEDEERRRIALVLHDDLQQRLAGLSIIHSILWKSTSPSEQRELRAKADEILDGAAALTRTLASEVSPPSLAVEDFAETLRWLAARKREDHRLDVSVEVDGECEVPDRGVRALLYHALHELLFNVVKHAGTGRATVRARRDGEAVEVVVEDDGDGFDGAAAAPGDGGLGLFSVRERIEMAGGSLGVDSEPGRGARVTLRVPADGPEAQG
ncbi:chemotaxis protein CheB [Rubrivirga sp.]|uniref:chemotaxis protein CheB n=1 Tax=Rubrivirga sp. TaxID=1885344 RepID=UPI003B5211ED